MATRHAEAWRALPPGHQCPLDRYLLAHPEPLRSYLKKAFGKELGHGAAAPLRFEVANRISPEAEEQLLNAYFWGRIMQPPMPEALRAIEHYAYFGYEARLSGPYAQTGLNCGRWCLTRQRHEMRKASGKNGALSINIAKGYFRRPITSAGCYSKTKKTRYEEEIDRIRRPVRPKDEPPSLKEEPGDAEWDLTLFFEELEEKMFAGMDDPDVK
jgi:hypothetical protein